MDFSRKGVVAKQHAIKSTTKRLTSKIRIFLFRVILVCVVGVVIVGVLAAGGAAKGIIDSAPDVSQVNIDPEGFTTHIYYRDGTLSQSLIGAEANRVLVTIDQIPDILEKCFVALEDERFYEHDGIDVRGLFRAGYSFVKTMGDFAAGASTITQQLLKTKVFNYGNEPVFMDKVTRKLQEQYLAIKIENLFTKDEIMEAYLNNINLGNGSFGVQTAAQSYFGKDVWDLTLSEAAVIAPLALSPVKQNPIKYPEANAERREACLTNMLKLNYITKEQYDEALADDVYARIQFNDEQKQELGTTYYSYFTDELIEQVIADLVNKKGYTQDEASYLLYSGGLEIYSTQDKTIQSVLNKQFTDESNFPAVGDGSYYQLNESTYALSIQKADGQAVHYHINDLYEFYKDYNDSDHKYYHKSKPYTGINSLCYDKEDLEAKLEAFKQAMMDKDDIVLGEVVNITLQPQTSMTIMDQYTGQVVALYGGRGEKTANRTLNRATNTRRQVGSTFKVLAAFLPAIDSCGYTLGSVMDDSEYEYPDGGGSVRNWDKVYKGLSSMREAIYNSMNIVACRFLEAVSPRLGYDYLKKLGFNLVESYTNSNGQTFSDINYALALGGITFGVTNMELTAGYAAIANNGIYNAPVLYTKIIDHNGKVLLSNEPSSEQIFKTSTAWLLTNAMEDTVKIGTSTRCRFKEYNMAVAGKSGTSTNEYDLWFVGYTPYYTAAIWTGFDFNFTQTAKSYHKTLWRKVMEEVHSTLQLETKEFQKPDSITTAVICTKCGNLAIPGVCDQAQDGNKTRTEYFAKGTAPTKSCTCHVKVSVCKTSGHIASPYCPVEDVEDVVYLIKTETSPTYDTPYIYPTDEKATVCPIHSEGTIAPPVDDGVTDEFDDDFNFDPDDDSGYEDDSTVDPTMPPVIVLPPDDNE